MRSEQEVQETIMVGFLNVKMMRKSLRWKV